MDAALLFALILLNGFFAMSELALVSARRIRLQQHADDGDRGAAAAVSLAENPTRFLSALQIGITAIGVLNGIIGEATFAEPFARWMQRFGLPQRASEIGATALVVVTVTYFTIVLGELVPKRLGQITPEVIARRVARPILWLAMITTPFVRVLSGSTEFVLRLLRVRTTSGQAVTEEEIHAIITEGSEAGVIDQEERDIVRNVFRLDDRQVQSLMTPRSEILSIDLEASVQENLKVIGNSQHSRFPLCRGDLSDILGIVTAKGLLAQVIEGKSMDFASDFLPAVFVPESLTGLELLQTFRSSHVQIVLVVDEYGEIQGLVTLQDVFEAIIGEFKPNTADDAWAIQRSDGSWLLDGSIPVPELKDRLQCRELPEEERGRYHTLAGMLLLLTGRIPKIGDKVSWDGWTLEIVDMDGRRIDKVLASRIAVEVATQRSVRPAT